MATKASEILARTQSLGYGTDTEAAQLLMLNMIHKRIVNQRRWRFLQKLEGSINTTAGTNAYIVDTFDDTKRVDAVRLRETPSNRGLDLEYVEPQSMRTLELEGEEEGTPEYWTIIGQEIHLYPTPNRVFNVKVDTVSIPVELTTGNSEIQIPDSHSDILVWGMIMALTFRERDMEGHNFARQMYSELLAEMMAQFGMSNRQSAARVQASGFYDQFDPESQWLI